MCLADASALTLVTAAPNPLLPAVAPMYAVACSCCSLARFFSRSCTAHKLSEQETLASLSVTLQIPASACLILCSCRVTDTAHCKAGVCQSVLQLQIHNAKRGDAATKRHRWGMRLNLACGAPCGQQLHV